MAHISVLRIQVDEDWVIEDKSTLSILSSFPIKSVAKFRVTKWTLALAADSPPQLTLTCV